MLYGLVFEIFGSKCDRKKPCVFPIFAGKKRGKNFALPSCRLFSEGTGRLWTEEKSYLRKCFEKLKSRWIGPLSHKAKKNTGNCLTGRANSNFTKSYDLVGRAKAIIIFFSRVMYNYTNSGRIKSNYQKKIGRVNSNFTKRVIRIYSNIQEYGRVMSNIAE